jgi:hypothetical protein
MAILFFGAGRAVAGLGDAGLLNYRRHIANPDALKEVACECSNAVRLQCVACRTGLGGRKRPRERRDDKLGNDASRLASL